MCSGPIMSQALNVCNNPIMCQPLNVRNDPIMSQANDGTNHGRTIIISAVTNHRRNIPCFDFMSGTDGRVVTTSGVNAARSNEINSLVGPRILSPGKVARGELWVVVSRNVTDIEGSELDEARKLKCSNVSVVSSDGSSSES